MTVGVSFISLDESIREASGERLHVLLWTLEDLVLQTRAAEYNARGTSTHEPIAELTSTLRTHVEFSSTTVGLRLRVLGVPVTLNMAAITKGSLLLPFPGEEIDGLAIVGLLGASWRTLSSVYAQIVEEVRAADPVSARVVEGLQLEHEGLSTRFQAWDLSDQTAESLDEIAEG